MTRRSRIGLVVAALFTLANIVSAVIVAAMGELPHAGLHAALALLGAYPVWRLAPLLRADRVRRQEEAAIPSQRDELADRLTNIEQSVDAVAFEVERIGEGQRFMTRVFTEKGAEQALGEGVAAPLEIKEREAASNVRQS